MKSEVNMSDVWRKVLVQVGRGRCQYSENTIFQNSALLRHLLRTQGVGREELAEGQIDFERRKKNLIEICNSSIESLFTFTQWLQREGRRSQVKRESRNKSLKACIG